jgi:hypothetical protein
MSAAFLSPGAPTSWPSRQIGVLVALCGWFMLYLAIGGTVGLFFSAPGDGASHCMPALVGMGLLESTCPSEAVNLFWAMTVGIPRALLVLPALAAEIVLSAIQDGTAGFPGFARFVDWLLIAGPALLVIGAGIHYWRRRNTAIAVLITALLLLAVATVRMLLFLVPLPSS